MLENASRQLFLTLLAIAAGIVCCLLFKLPLGHDLRGGTQIRYEVPPEVIAKLKEKEVNVSVDKIMDDTMAVIRERLDPNGALDPTITRSGETGILIELPWFEDPTELKRTLERVGNLGKLEFRIVADKDFIDGSVSFDMQREKQKLEQWLKQEGNKKLLLEDPRKIRTFNEDQIQGPIQFGNLAWYARKLGEHPKKPGQWDDSWTTYPALSQATVKIYEDTEWNNGLIPDAFKAKPEKDRFLIELIAVNMKEKSFRGEDLDPAGTSAGPGRDGGLAVHYSVAPGLEMA